jgi:capsular polysaccharide biosynthesis protein
MLLMGAAIGLMAGLGLAWFRETWNQKFHTEAEIEDILGIPVIAVIPNLKEDKAA